MRRAAATAVRCMRFVGALGVAAYAALATPTPLTAQDVPSARVSGTIRSAEGPVLAAEVTLVADGRVRARTETDRDGRFTLDAPPGRYQMAVRRLSYAPWDREVVLTAGSPLEVEVVLVAEAVELGGVGVEAERSRERRRFEEIAGLSVREITREQLKLVPGLGEADPVRSVEVLPGVVSTSDFSSSFHVRGGSADQNLILLDGTPIFSPFHLGGFFSVFNADMVDRAELASGGFPAQYGGRVSSVLTIESDPGDGEFGVDAGVSILATRVALKGGLGEGARTALRLSDLRWRVSARRSYFDALLAPVVDFPYHLRDLQAVVDAGIGRRDRIRFTAYTGDDVLRLTNLDDGFPLRIDWDWGNDVAGLRWTRSLARGSWVTSASFTRFGTGLLFPDFGDTDFSSRVVQRSLRTGLDLRLAAKARLGVGAMVEDATYRNRAVSGGTEFQAGLGDGVLSGGHVQLELGSAGDRLAELGVRFDHWRPSPGRSVGVVSPRLSLKQFFAGSRWAVNASAGRYTQFVHSLRDEELPLGLDIWVLSGARAPHVVSDQVQLGIEAFPNDTWSFSAEAYLRDFEGVVTFNTGDDPNDPLDDILAGTGRSWGADFFVRRSGTPVNGWLSLSFLEADRTFPDLLSPEPVPPEVTYAPIFDRRIDLDLVLRFPAPRGWDGGLRLNVGTGTPYTRPLASYATYQPRFLRNDGRADWEGADDGAEDDGGGGYAVLLGDRNRERYPIYHRLDLSFRREIRRSWGTLTPHIDILNVYNRRNVLFYFFEYDRTPATRSGISMFPLLPTVGLEVRF